MHVLFVCALFLCMPASVHPVLVRSLFYVHPHLLHALSHGTPHVMRAVFPLSPFASVRGYLYTRNPLYLLPFLEILAWKSTSPLSMPYQPTVTTWDKT
jgi:hypothetical protein